MIRKYGLEFDGSPTELDIELAAYRAGWPLRLGGLGKEGHFREALKLMPFTVSGAYKLTPWTERRLRGFCDPRQRLYWWGPGSSGKSTDAAAFLNTHYMAAPSQTRIVTISTTRDMLEQRIFSEIVRLNSAIRPAIAKYISTEVRLEYISEPGDEKLLKAGIFGVAILQGTMQEALGNIIGAHMNYNVLCIDEMQATKKVATKAEVNMRMGAKELIILGMGNPSSPGDPLGEACIPNLPGGYKAISHDTHEEWATENGGLCQFFDGRKSPAIANPKEFPFLIKQADIDAIANNPEFGENSHEYWSQCIGFLPPDNVSNTVLSEADIKLYNTKSRDVKFRFVLGRIAALDPAFTTGGDKCAMTFATVGIDSNNVMTILFTEDIVIKIPATRNLSVGEHIARECIAECTKRGIGPRDLAIDATNNQIAEIIEMRWQPGIFRVNSKGKASDLPVSDTNLDPASKHYGNKVTELWMTFANFSRNGNIRGMGQMAIDDFTERKIKKYRPMTLETKEEMRDRLGRSPDFGDVYAVATSHIRERMGVMPGWNLQQRVQQQSAGRTGPSVHDIDARMRKARGLT